MKEQKSYSGKKAVRNAKTVFLCFAFLLYMAPFFLVIVNSLKRKVSIVKEPLLLIDKNGLQWENYLNAIDQMNFVRAFGNSLLITVVSVIILLSCSSMAAYLFVRADWKICRASFAAMLMSMIVPFQVVMIPLVSIYGAKLNLLNSRFILILMNFGFGTSMCTFMCHGFIKSSVPVSLEEAARIDGASSHGIFFRIVFPLMKPILSTIAILEILGFWNDYLLPSLVLGKEELYTLPLAIRTFYGTFTNDYGNIMAGLVLSVIPVIIVYILLQKYIIGGIVAGAVKS